MARVTVEDCILLPCLRSSDDDVTLWADSRIIYRACRGRLTRQVMGCEASRSCSRTPTRPPRTRASPSSGVRSARRGSAPTSSRFHCVTA